MADTKVEDVKAPAAEQKAEAAAPQIENKAEPKAEPKTEVKGEAVGDLFKADEKESKMVPESQLLSYKNEIKGLRKELNRVQEMVAEGASKSEVSESLKDIAKEFNVDEKFITKLSAAIKAEADADIDEKVSSKLKPLAEKENAQRIDKIFNDHFERTLEQMPEYRDIVNKEAVKSLTLDPANANKTFAQILESAYGHLVQGKRTIDAAKPRGGKEPAPLDYEKARKDSTYFKEVMADPTLKKEYNSELHRRLRL
jgi:hypothetical protein